MLTDRCYGRWAEDYLWVVDAGDSHEIPGGVERSQLIQLDLLGRLVIRYSAFGSEPVEIDLRHDVAMGLDGQLFVAEIRNKRLQVLNRTQAVGINPRP